MFKMSYDKFLNFFKKLPIGLILTGVILLLVLFGGNNHFFEKNNNLEFPPVALAGENDNLFGFAWSDTIGWISFNCVDGGDIGAGQSNICDTSNYGVTVGGDNKLSGYAWSDNIGWISFNESDLVSCLKGDCKAKLVGNTYLSGWARALAGKDADDGWDGWDGWISLSTQSGGGIDYGVTLNGEDFSGFAWGGEVVGWISFNCVDTESCGTSDYKVVFTDNFPQILTFQVNNTVTGTNPTAEWTTKNVIRCVLASDTGYSSESDVCTGTDCLNKLNFEIDFPVGEETTYTLTCYNGAGVETSSERTPSEYFELNAEPTAVSINFVGGSATTTPTNIGVTSYNGFKDPVSFSADLSELPESQGEGTINSYTFSPTSLSSSQYLNGGKSNLEIFASDRFTGGVTVPVWGNNLDQINITINAGKINPIYEEI